MFRSTTPVPATRDECPAVQAALARLYELHGEEKKLDVDLEAINSDILSARSRSAINSDAHDLLNRGVATLIAPSHLHDQREQVQPKLRVVRRAIELARAKVDEARSASANRIAESRGPEYRGIVAELKQKIEALQSAMEKERAFRHRSDDLGAAAGALCLRPMNLGIEYRLDAWLAEAQEYFGV